jgi:lysophospholipase L1-like esterase
MHRRILVLLASALTFVLGAGVAQAAPSSNGFNNGTGYYVALGDSLAAGFQPTTGDNKTDGYVGYVAATVRATYPKTRLVNLACSGETTTTMIDGGLCSYRTASQLGDALQFIHAHRNHLRLITIDIGANDVGRCVRDDGTIDFDCLSKGLAALTANLPTIFNRLRAAAPNVQIVAVNYYDPFLADWLTGPDGRDLAHLSVALVATLNSFIATAATAVDGTIADVFTAFQTTNFTIITVPGLGRVPTNVAIICRLTWMCVLQDVHPNDAGYALIGATVSAVVMPSAAPAGSRT